MWLAIHGQKKKTDALDYRFVSRYFEAQSQRLKASLLTKMQRLMIDA
jgi:hypothetical protein